MDYKLSDLLRGDAVSACFVEYEHPPIEEMDRRTRMAEVLEAENAELKRRVVNAHELIDGVGRMDDWRERAEEWLAQAK